MRATISPPTWLCCFASGSTPDYLSDAALRLILATATVLLSGMSNHLVKSSPPTASD
jgi:hypothetical protein